MIDVVTEIRCDGCGTVGVTIRADGTRRTAARIDAHRAGWFTNGRELCPDCRDRDGG